MNKIILLLVLLVFSPLSFSSPSFKGHVTAIDPSGMPSSIYFKMDVGDPTCYATKWLRWANTNQDNLKVIYSTLTTALVSGKEVVFFYADGDTACAGTFLHIESE